MLPSGKQLFWLNNIIGPLLFVAVPLGTAPRSGIAIDAKLVVVRIDTISVFKILVVAHRYLVNFSIEINLSECINILNRFIKLIYKKFS